MQKPSRGPDRPELSIVIPASSDVAAFEETLVSVLENRPADTEIIAALGCDYADPWNIGEEVRFVAAPRGAGLAACLNAGIAAATGRVIHALAAGWRATEGWTERPLAHFTRGGVAAVVPLVVADADRDRVVSAGIRTTRGGRRIENGRGLPLAAAGDGSRLRAPAAPTLQAGFWSPEVLADVGGFPTACGDPLADADLVAAVSCTRAVVVLEPGSIVVAGAAPDRGAAFTAGLAAERLFWRSLAAGAVAPALVSHAWEVVRHACSTAPLGTVPMLFGRLCGLVQFGDHAARARALAALRERAADAAVTTLRIDQGHELPALPKSRSMPAPLRRSA